MNVQEQIIWSPGIYQLEETDLVLGGPTGIANQQAKDLANRTIWLRNELYKIGQYKDVIPIFGSAGIGDNQPGILFVLSKNGGTMDIQLPFVKNVPKGAIFTFVSEAINGTPARFITSNPDKFGFYGNLYLHSYEAVTLVADNGFWRLANYSGNFLNVGTPVYGYKVQPNTLIRNGQLVSRAAYPRLWEWVSTLPPETLINDFLWNSALDYCGTFSTGDGITNFRLPDDRGMFERGLDLGRGIDLDRPHNFAGGYEKDEFKSHTHPFNPADNNGRSDNANDRDVMVPGSSNKTTGATGGRETRPVNIGKIPLILY